MSIAERFLKIYMQKTGIQECQLPDDFHPERLALIQYCYNGKGIDVGCGYRKTHPNCIGVDLIPSGETGEYGCVAGKSSVADIVASGDNLHMFADGELDFVVSRHNLEHYIDVIKTLLEWKRVLKIGGVMAAVLPDERGQNTIALDPTHKHVFTPESYRRYIDLIGGFRVIEIRTIGKNWSFLFVAQRIS
jgi:SAM-dependent methyltransferase